MYYYQAPNKKFVGERGQKAGYALITAGKFTEVCALPLGTSAQKAELLLALIQGLEK